MGWRKNQRTYPGRRQYAAPMRPSTGQKCRRCGRAIEENRVRLRIDPAFIRGWLSPRHGDPAYVANFTGRMQDASGTNSWWGSRPEYCNDCTVTLNIQREPRHRHGGHPRRDRRGPALGRRG